MLRMVNRLRFIPDWCGVHFTVGLMVLIVTPAWGRSATWWA